MNFILLIFPVLFPAAASVPLAVIPGLRKRMPRRIYVTAVLAAVLAAAVLSAVSPPAEVTLLRLSDALVFSLRSDGPAGFFCILASVMFFLAGIYAFEYMEHEKNPDRFFAFYLLVLGMLNGLGLSANLLTLYLFYELLTLAAMPLVLHSMTKEAISASFKFMFYSFAGAALGLLGLFYVYQNSGTLDFVPGGVLGSSFASGARTEMQIASLLVIIGFSGKAGLFPLHAWLPSAHPQAPSPASAVLSGVITKAGVLAVFRFVFYSIGADFIRGTWVQTVWTALTLITILMGSVLAFKEPMLKKRMAYSSISQVSYVLFGLSVLSSGGMLGSMLHTVFHSIGKDLLFMIAGIIILQTGRTKVSELKGLGKEMPVTFWCFAIAGAAMTGIPPSGGFVSKWYLASGALSADIGIFRWLGPAVLLISALLTAGYLLAPAADAFFPGTGFVLTEKKNREPSGLMLIPVLLLTAACILTGIFPGILIRFFESFIKILV